MARITVTASGPVANVVIKRADGHELSLSSMGHGNLIEWNEHGTVVSDWGDWNINAVKFLKILDNFLQDEDE